MVTQKQGPWKRQLYLETHKPSTCVNYYNTQRKLDVALSPASYNIDSWTDNLKHQKNTKKGNFSTLQRESTSQRRSRLTFFQPLNPSAHDFKKVHVSQVDIGRITARKEIPEPGSRIAPPQYNEATIKENETGRVLSFMKQPTGSRFGKPRKPMTHSCPFYEIQRYKNTGVSYTFQGQKLPKFAAGSTAHSYDATLSQAASAGISRVASAKNASAAFNVSEPRFHRQGLADATAWVSAGPGRYNLPTNPNKYSSQHQFQSESIRFDTRMNKL